MRPNIITILIALFTTALVGRAAAFILSADDVVRSMPARAEPAPPVDQTFAELDQWEAGLEAREREVESRAIVSEMALADVERREAALKMKAAAREKEQEKARKLAAVYTNMDTDRAASAIRALPVARAAEIISAMSPDIAGPILSAIDIDHSNAIVTAMVDLD